MPVIGNISGFRECIKNEAGGRKINPVSSLRMQSEAGIIGEIIVQPVEGCRCHVIERKAENSGDASRVDINP